MWEGIGGIAARIFLRDKAGLTDKASDLILEVIDSNLSQDVWFLVIFLSPSGQSMR